VTGKTISGFAYDVVMRLVTAGKGCAYEQQQKQADAIRRLPEEFEQSLLEIDGSHRETT